MGFNDKGEIAAGVWRASALQVAGASAVAENNIKIILWNIEWMVAEYGWIRDLKKSGKSQGVGGAALVVLLKPL